jgi:hypothetical protein
MERRSSCQVSRGTRRRLEGLVSAREAVVPSQSVTMAGGRWREVEGQQLRQRLSQRQRQQQQFPFQPAKKRQTKSIRGTRMSKKGGDVQKRLRVVKSTSREGWEVVENGDGQLWRRPSWAGRPRRRALPCCARGRTDAADRLRGGDSNSRWEQSA